MQRLEVRTCNVCSAGARVSHFCALLLEMASWWEASCTLHNPRGSKYLIMKESGLKDHIYHGFP